MEHLRVIHHSPASGEWNMAVDEALLESAAGGQATVRFYAWARPTLSLGYFQALGERAGHRGSLECPLVRRASGGGAILHDCELTYSLAIGEPPGSARIAAGLYDQVHQSLIETLQVFQIDARLHGREVCKSASGEPAEQPFLCFQRRSCTDIVYRGAKIAGSAQRRRRGGVLQHGSVLLGASSFAAELPGIRELTGQAIALEELVGCWVPRLAATLGRAAERGDLSEHERERAERLAEGQFGTVGWLERR
jgi:lipoate-protein ligase A